MVLRKEFFLLGRLSWFVEGVCYSDLNSRDELARRGLVEKKYFEKSSSDTVLKTLQKLKHKPTQKISASPG